jgi:hypothetical protein
MTMDWRREAARFQAAEQSHGRNRLYIGSGRLRLYA